jgi:hypothetical protein
MPFKMVYSLNYRRPAHRDVDTKSLSEGSIDESIRSGNWDASSGIPDALSFDRIIAGGTCPVSRLVSRQSPY